MLIIGIYLGIIFEKNQIDNMESFYSQSEISLIDIVALNNLIDAKNISCSVLKKASFDFADRIYEEALLLEDYEKSGKITENIKSVHTKYDLLRTFLWMNSIKIKNQCPSHFSSVVYLYNYSTEDLTQKAEQSVWSKVLYELKSSNSDKILLIPISVDQSLVSLDSLKNDFNITNYPVVIINEKKVIYSISSVSDLEKYII
jgi:hypothetical protein